MTDNLIQQNYPEPPPVRPNAKKRDNRRRSQLSFEEYLRRWHDYIKIEQDKNRKLCEMSVTIRRRDRGLTISDMCGRYGTRFETNGRFLEYDPELDGEVHPINVVQPALRSNTNACLQSDAEIEVNAANASAKNKQIADRWQRVVDFVTRSIWDENTRNFIFDAVQKDGNILLEIYTDESETQIVPNIVTKGEEISIEENEIPLSEIKLGLVPFFNFTIDAYGAKTNGIDSAKWLQISRLKTRAEMETKYSQFDFNSSRNWSYQMRCDYALASNDWNYLNNFPSDGNGFDEFERFEEKTIYLHEEAYSNFVARDAFEFVNGNGELVFRIEAGQTIAEALEAQYGFNPKGFAFVWEDERLIDIVSPEKEETNFREKESVVHFLRDSSSFLSSPNYSIVHIQDDITLLNTMNHNIIARNAVIPVYYDSLVFEEADFSQEFIPTKNSALLNDRGIERAVTSLPVPTPSPALMGQLTFLWEVKDSVSQSTPAMRGEQQKGETYAAQRQQLEQAYGMLTSVLKSFATAKARIAKQAMRLIKKKWTLEQFQRVASAFGEIWTDEDVQEMCEIDFERDLIVDYRQGSEMPASNWSKEIKFYQGLSQLLPFVQSNPQMLGQDKLTRILAKIDEYSDFDFDLTGLEIDEIIAQKRYIELVKIASEAGEVSLEQIEQAKAQIIGYDPTGQPISKFDTAIEQIFYKSEIRFNEYENLEQQKTFFIEQLRAETGKGKTNYLLIELIQVVIGFIDQAISEDQADEILSTPEMQTKLAMMKAQQDEESRKSKEEKEKADGDGKAEFERKMIESAAGHEAEMQKMTAQGEINQMAEAQKATATAN